MHHRCRFNYFLEHLCLVECRINILIHFFFKFILRCQQSDIVPIIAAGVVDTGGAPSLASISANFRKNRNYPNVNFGGLGEDDSGKKPEAKNLVTLSLKAYERRLIGREMNLRKHRLLF